MGRYRHSRQRYGDVQRRERKENMTLAGHFKEFRLIGICWGTWWAGSQAVKEFTKDKG